MKLRTRFRRIGITGSARAGKTVFLLSLINHLKWGETFGVHWRGKEECRPSLLAKLLRADDRPEFEYDALRKHLAEKKVWPGKTTDSSHFRCRFSSEIKASGFGNLFGLLDRMTDHVVEFFDFPGERAADVMMIDRSYDEWSDALLRSVKEDSLKAVAAEPFLRLAGAESTRADEIISAWRLTLAHLILDCHSLVTPSTFLVDVGGKTASQRVRELRGTPGSNGASLRETAEELASAGCSGLPSREFAPLPLSSRRSSPEIAQQFRDNYRWYQKRVVQPLAADLLSCHSLIYLVDVPDVLGSGVQKLNDTLEIIQRLIECIERGRGVIKTLLRKAANVPRSILGGKCGAIERMAFVASKADKVRILDRDNLKKFVDPKRWITMKRPITVKSFSGSAVTSTSFVKNDDTVLAGRPMWTFKDGKTEYSPPNLESRPVHVRVPQLPPEGWPDRWEPEDFQYADFHPEIPAVFKKPPQQFGLKSVLEFALDVKL